MLNEQSLVRDADLLVLDEVSMVGADMAADLLAFGKPILVLGDPGQLPPIRGEGAFTDAAPDVLLTEIHRQAEESAVLRLATMARKGEPIPFGEHDPFVWKMRRTDVPPEQMLNGGQVICGRNATRRVLNTAMKAAAGFPHAYPEGRGEKIICLKNRHDLGLVNGMFLELSDVRDEDEHSFSAVVRTEDGAAVPGRQRFYKGEFDDHVSLRSRPRDGATGTIKRELIETVWGCAITCHKAQGSQWQDVIVFDDGLGRTAEERARWLYTAITRAERGLVLLDLISTTSRSLRPAQRFDLDAVVAGLRDDGRDLGAAALPERPPGRRRVAAGQHPRRRPAEHRLLRHRAQGPARRRLDRLRWRRGRRADQRNRAGDRPQRADAHRPCRRDSPGVDPGRAAAAGAAAAAAPRRDPAPEIDLILSRAVPIQGTPAERYLAGRGLAVPDAADLLFHPDLTHWESGSGYPALIGVVRDRDGDDRRPAPHLPRRAARRPGRQGRRPRSRGMMLGTVAGGAVRLGPIADGAPLALCEGIETGLAALTARPGPVGLGRAVDRRARAGRGAGERHPRPDPGRQRRLRRRRCAPPKPRPAGSAAKGARSRSPCRRARATTSTTCCCARGPPPSRVLIAAARMGRRRGDAAADRTAPAARTTPSPARRLPTMRADEGDLARAVEKAWSLLAASNRTPWLFRYAGIPTWVVPDDEGRPVAVEPDRGAPAAHAGAPRRLAAAERQGRARRGPAAARRWCSRCSRRPIPALPVLLGIVNTPVFGRNGNLLTDARLSPGCAAALCAEPRLRAAADPGATDASRRSRPRAS